MPPPRYDAIVIGSGPNGLAAAITLARAGRSVLVQEGAQTIGGSCRSDALTQPGFVHDTCATVQALVPHSPLMRSLPLAEHGLQLAFPLSPVAQPLDGGVAAVLERSVDATADELGPDADAYRRLMKPLVDGFDSLAEDLLAPPTRVPRHPLRVMRFGLRALGSARGLVDGLFKAEPAKALFGGLAAHSVAPLEWKATAAIGLVLAASAHAGGWPVARGGSQNVIDAMASYFRSLGGEIATGQPLEKIEELPPARVVLCDVTPRQLLRIAGDKFPAAYRSRLEKFRYGPGIFKVDWALNGPIPWRAEGCTRAGTVHVCGTFNEMAAAERTPWRGEHAERPYVLLVQPTPWDETRAPPGKHTAWGYCHVPSGSIVDMTERIEGQVERFAPGFRDRILARHTMNCAAMERHNPNLVGGDVTGGANVLSQLLTRPLVKWDPYRTPVEGLFICSASTPPGAGVHGICGYWAARSALKLLT
ncbi:MAG TPA: NAD(P)/FAD-dependent oxidoreductase [Tepidisphaeraceae bacterium]|nr:NAD(P)/FAD-dependent oxidoreductase [Tepidisphaeraceae bacterium]